MHRHIAVRAFAVIAVAGAMGVASAPVVEAQELGQIFAYVLGPTGQPVTDLMAEEFSVTEDGVDTKILSAQVGTAPMRVALLVDNGQGLRDDVSQLRAGLTAFLQALPPQHVVGLFTIGGQVRRLEDFTTDRARLLGRVNNVFPDRGNTRVLDGVRETWDRYYEGDEAWPVFVMVLTDGTEHSAFMSEDRYGRWMNGVRQAGVMIHAIQVTTRRGSPITHFALNLAGSTGGRYRSVATATALTGELTTLATDMGTLHDQVSNAYRILFERADPSGDSISLSVARPGVDLRLFGERRLDP